MGTKYVMAGEQIFSRLKRFSDRVAGKTPSPFIDLGSSSRRKLTNLNIPQYVAGVWGGLKS